MRLRLVLLAGIVVSGIAPAAGGARELRVCADPNNLPFSNAQREGFENKIVALVADELAASPRYLWWPQRRGFVRNTLKAGLCDVVPGVPSNLELLRTTEPYYRSSYVFVSRIGGPSVASLDDPTLRDLRVGVQLIGDDGANSPPADALARRGIVKNVRGYPVYGNYGKPRPGAAIVDAVVAGDVDVAVVWGPTAGYFAQQASRQLRLTPVSPQFDGPQMPMAFDISMGVRKEDQALRDEIDSAIEHRRAAIDAILAGYSVPRLDRTPVSHRSQ